MYEQFYGFSEGPFNPLPDPSFLFLTPSHDAALSAMISGVRERRGITVITGGVGVGKTTLINELFTTMDEKVKSAFVFFTKLNFRDLLKTILRELDVPVKGTDTFALLEKFYGYLEERGSDEIVAVVIDEAQNLEMDVLKQLLRLWAHPNPRSRSLQTVLVGQPEFGVRLNAPELAELSQRIAVRREIIPLTRPQTRTYIDHRLKVVGSSSSSIFEPKAIERICDFAEGIPRVINMVCDAALLIGYARSARTINARMIKEATHDLRHLRSPKAGKTPLARFEPEPPDEDVPVEPETSSDTSPSLEPTSLQASYESGPVTEPVSRELPSGPVQSEKPRRMKPLYQVLAGVLLLLAALGLYLVLTGNPPPPPKISSTSTPLQTSTPLKKGKTETKAIATVNVEKGTTLNALAKRHYGITDLLVLDLILQANPRITDPHLLQVNQKVELPAISAASFLVPASGQGYKIIVGTFSQREAAGRFRNDPVLKGKNIETVARPVSTQQTWYRVLAGTFQTEEEALQAIRGVRNIERIVGIAERTARTQ